MNKKLTFFQKGALDIMFYEDNDIDTWYNIVDIITPYLLEGDEINPVYNKLSLKKIRKSLLEIEDYLKSIYQQGIIDFNEKDIENEVKEFISEYLQIDNKNIEEQIEKDSIIEALGEIFCNVDDNTYNRYLEGKLKIDPSNNSDEDFDVVCEKYEMYGERLLLEEIESLSYNYKQIMYKYYQLGKKGI